MLYLLLALFSLAPANDPGSGTEDQDPQSAHPPPVEWLQDMTVQAEDALRNAPISYTFRFRNLTDAPLLIENVRVGCGCTATDWAETPVAPGAEGSINVTYDAANVGFYRKYVKVYFHGHRGGHKLWLEGYVEPDGR